MKHLVSALAALSLAALSFAVPANAETIKSSPKAVIELFTSQGCSSCPPADAYFDQLAKRPDLVTLAYHVDYWDYIGWPDTFGSTAHSDLQRDYAKANGQMRIYTPQIVIDGERGMVGSDKRAVQNAIDDTALPVAVTLTRTGNILDISVAKAPKQAESAIWLVPFRSSATVKIERGENRGRAISYAAIAGERQVLGMWEPATGAHVRVPLNDILSAGNDGVAVLLQEDRNGLPGPILGAASLTR